MPAFLERFAISAAIALPLLAAARPAPPSALKVNGADATPGGAREPVIQSSGPAVFSWESPLQDARISILKRIPGGTPAPVPGASAECRSNSVEWAAAGLESFTRYEWRVSVLDESGEMSAPESGVFSTGVLHPGDWAGAKSIVPADGLEHRTSGLDSPAICCYRRVFRRPSAAAEAWIAAEAPAGTSIFVNGRKFDFPGGRAAFDVSKAARLAAGASNVVAVDVPCPAGETPSLRLLFVSKGRDGSAYAVPTGEDWDSATFSGGRPPEAKRLRAAPLNPLVWKKSVPAD